jgi:hypothetical protein
MLAQDDNTVKKHTQGKEPGDIYMTGSNRQLWKGDIEK